MPKLTDEQREVQRFRVHHPDFVESPKNVKIINDFLRVNKLSTTLENLQAAFASEFLQLDHSNAPAPAPVVPVTPTPAPASVPPPPARPMVLPPWEKKYGRALDADMVRNISLKRCARI